MRPRVELWGLNVTESDLMQVQRAQEEKMPNQICQYVQKKSPVNEGPGQQGRYFLCVMNQTQLKAEQRAM